MLAINIVLAVVWMIATGSLHARGLLVGLILGYVLLGLVSLVRPIAYVRRVWAGMVLLAFAIYEVLRSNLIVAWYTVSDLRALEPAVLRVPLEPDLTNGELTLLSVLVTLTPGTLSIDISQDRQSLYVHIMHVEDPDKAIRSITDGFERRILEMRP
ncbi:MAG: Na+/H+ antiporter subunit E [Planctomycetota bacterium]